MKLLNKLLLSKNLEDTAKKDLSMEIVSGYNVCVVQNTEVVYKNNFGTTSFENNIPLSDKTVFRLASMTKPITTVAVMQLVEKGKLKLSDEICRFLPSFEKMRLGYIDSCGKLAYGNEAKTKITIFHLLTHTSGLGSGEVGRLQMSIMSKQQKATLSGFVDAVADTALSFEPFTKTEYSGVAAFDVLSRIVELIEETDFQSYLKKNIFDKCEMNDTCFEPSKEVMSRLVSMSDRVNGKGKVGRVIEGNIFEDYPCTHHNGGAGLVSTIDDYSLFAQMLLSGGKHKENTILSKESVKLISNAAIPEEIQKGSEQWGLGVRVITGENVLPIGSYGWSGAYGGHFWIDPKNKITAVYLKNSRYDGGSSSKTARQFEKDVYNSMCL